MGRLHGITVTLYDQVETDIDAFGKPIYEEVPISVDNVLVGQPTTDDITSSTELYGKRVEYMLGIPKTDHHNWMDKKVSWIDSYGLTHVVKTFGFPLTGIDGMIPLDWHMKVRCEDYGN